MQTLRNLQELAQVGEFRNYRQGEQNFEDYKKNVRIFVQNMKMEVAQLIDNYEKTIAGLKAENQRLKDSIVSQQFVRTPPLTPSPSKQLATTRSSKIQQSKGILEGIQTARSKVYMPSKDRSFEDLGLSPFMLSGYNNEQDSCLSKEMNQEGPPFSKEASRFQVQNKRRKNREEELCSYLELGSKSMNLTTDRFMEVVGKNRSSRKQVDQQQIEQETIMKQNQEQQHSDNDSGLNRSLGAICESLDTSFISQKARSERKKRQGKLNEELEKKRQQNEVLAEMTKKKGIKNLLQRLRENVESSPKQQISTIKAPKTIISQKDEFSEQQTLSQRRNSKVIINPVPIDIQQKSKVIRKDRKDISLSSPNERKPHSILKQSTILTRSIAGISAIDFAI